MAMTLAMVKVTNGDGDENTDSDVDDDGGGGNRGGGGDRKAGGKDRLQLQGGGRKTQTIIN